MTQKILDGDGAQRRHPLDLLRPRSTATSSRERSGRYLPMGSLSRNRPSSHSIIAATDVMGLVME